MAIKCPSCGYERKPGDNARAPEYECPECGIVYAKFRGASAAGREQRATPLPVPPPSTNRTYDRASLGIPSNKGRLIVVIGVLLMGYVVGAPYWTVHQMRSAAKDRDGEALSEHIDFPSVRQSLKEQVNAMMMKEMSTKAELKENPFAALGMAFASTLVDKTVDTFVTPAGITQLMSGKKPDAEGHGEIGMRCSR
jgi:hypothetical protein